MPHQKLSQHSKSRVVAVEPRRRESRIWIYGIAFATAISLALLVYGPALRGQFVFDDLFLLYTNPHAASLKLADWMGLRPVLGLSFWANFQIAGLNTSPYHVANVLLHSASAILLFFIVRKVLGLANTTALTAEILACFASALFLLHPAQTESVAYIASRSENLSALFIFGAVCAFLYRPSTEIRWPSAIAVLILFGCAMGTKEHAIAVPALLLLTDYFWNPGFGFRGIRGNWRLYIPILFVGAAAAVFVWNYVSRDPMIGFHIQGLTWYQYFFTECRAFFGYIRLFLLPAGLNVDHEFAESHTIAEHGAALALAGLIALIGAAIVFRRRYPLACYGFFVFLMLLAPTSSFIPIRDVFVERRLYLPSLGLLLVLMEPLKRVQLPPKILALLLACLCLIPAYMTWRRAAVWTSAIRLWEDSVATSPGKARPHIGLGNAYMQENRCIEAVRQYQEASDLSHADFTLKYNQAAAYECAKQPAKALLLLNDAIVESPSAAPAYALRGLVLAEMGHWRNGLNSLERAQQLVPSYAPTHAYRGAIFALLGQQEPARSEFEICLQMDPNNPIARKGWAAINQGGAQ